MLEALSINDSGADQSSKKMTTQKYSMETSYGTIILQNVWHEFLAMFLFVFVCCGYVALNQTELSVLSISATFGLCITMLVYSIGHTSGGQINSAVTVALMVSGDVNYAQGLFNIIAQIFGAILGALFLWCITDGNSDLGANHNSRVGIDLLSVCIGEFMGTYLLCWVVFQTAVAEKSITRSKSNFNPVAAPIAIGAAVFLAHMLLINLTTCSINFPRSFGPALVATGKTGVFNGDGGKGFWVFFLMPHLAGVFAGAQRLLNRYMLLPEEEENLDTSQNKASPSEDLTENKSTFI